MAAMTDPRFCPWCLGDGGGDHAADCARREVPRELAPTDVSWSWGSLLRDVARRVEAEVGDGSAFFDRVDLELRDRFWYRAQWQRYALMAASTALSLPRVSLPVVSGAWGRGFVRAYPKWGALVLPGELRHADLPPIEEDLSGKSFVFLDDSCYLGRTRDKIRDRIAEAGGELRASLVLYDGSATGIDGMEGLYRYHDDH